MIPEIISAVSVMFMFLSRERDVWCLLSVVVLTVPGLLAPLGVCGAPRQCWPGGQYFDKHLGPRGRFVCCSELCEPGLFQDQCRKKCPNYEEDKARDTTTTVATPSDLSIGHMIESPPPDNDNTSPSTLTLYILLPVAVVLLFIVLIALFLRVRDRGWRGLLPTISPQRGAPGVRYNGEIVVLQGITAPPSTPPQGDEVRRKLLAGSQPQDAEDRFPEGGSCGGNPVGGVCGGPARGGRQLCQTAKEEAPPIQEQGQEEDQAVAIC